MMGLEEQSVDYVLPGLGELLFPELPEVYSPSRGC